MTLHDASRRFALTCCLILAACSSDDDSKSDGGAGSALPDAPAQVDRVDAQADSASAPDASADAQRDASLDVAFRDGDAGEARADVSMGDVADAGVRADGGDASQTPDRVDANIVTDTGSDASDATLRDASPPLPEASPTAPDAADGGYASPDCAAPVVPHLTPTSAIILDMEGDGLFTQALPPSQAGNWDQLIPYSENPDAGVSSPWEVSVISPARGASTHGIHSTGSGYPAYDANSSGGVGLALVHDFEVPLDASMYTGVSFWAKGSPLTTGLRVFTGLTTVLKSFCVCQEVRPTGGSGCNDVPYVDVPITSTWQQYTVKWAQLKQEGWGDPVPTDPRDLLNFLFRSIPPGASGTSGSWDFWLDDIAFSTTP